MIKENLDIDAYHADKTHISSTGIRKARKSLKLFKLWIDGYFDNEEKSCFDFGNAFELALLDHASFGKDVAIFNPEERPEQDKGITSKLNQEWKKSLYENNQYVINQKGRESYETIEMMLESCYQDAVIQRLLKNVEYQYSMYWTDSESGLKLKARPDICRSKNNVIVDVKAAVDGSPAKFSKALADYDLPLQAVMQIDGVIKSGFMPKVDNYFWLVVEKEPPFSATLYEFEQEDIKWVFDEYQYILNVVAQAMKEGKFPSYSYRADNPHGIISAAIPLWYRNYN